MPGSDQHTLDEAVHEQRKEGNGGAAASRAGEADTGGTHQPGPAGKQSGQPRSQRRITKAERAALMMKKARHQKALLWVDAKGQKVLAHMVEGEDARKPVVVPRGGPQKWLDEGWRIASWYANPKTGNAHITLIRPI